MLLQHGDNMEVRDNCMVPALKVAGRDSIRMYIYTSISPVALSIDILVYSHLRPDGLFPGIGSDS